MRNLQRLEKQIHYISFESFNFFNFKTLIEKRAHCIDISIFAHILNEILHSMWWWNLNKNQYLIFYRKGVMDRWDWVALDKKYSGVTWIFGKCWLKQLESDLLLNCSTLLSNFYKDFSLEIIKIRFHLLYRVFFKTLITFLRVQEYSSHIKLL